MKLALALPIVFAVAVQPDGLFTTREVAGDLVVAANRAAVPCDVALEELADALGWELRFSASALHEQLAERVVDLSFDGMSPRICANLLASAGGADVAFVERSNGDVDLVVVAVPDERTEAGRDRLRAWALDWYGSCLERATGDALDDASDDIVRVRMHMADLLRRQGRLQDATALLEQVYALAPDHPYVPVALLRMAECWFELGPDHWIEAERRARDLTRLHPTRPEAAVGTLLLGRILLAQGRAAECAAMLERAFLRMAGQPEIVDVYLLVAAARYRLDDPAGVAKALATLDGGHDITRLDAEQHAERAFLFGYADLESGRPRRAVRMFERWFAISEEDDPRRAEALVLLGRGYFADGRYLQARAAAVAARAGRDRLARRRAREAAELYASTSLALGEPDRALAELEAEVRRDPEGEVELTLFLAGSFLEQGRHARCIALLAEPAQRRDEVGDRARMLKIDARFAQASAMGELAGFVADARELAAELIDQDLQRRVAELVGRAHERMGDLEKAADAYRGVLR